MLEGALKIKETAARCKRWRMPALGLTDTNNMCGALEFSDIMAGEGVQPIIGVTLSLDLELDAQPGQLRRDPDGTVALLAQTETGYENLMALSSAAFLDVEATDLPHVAASRLEGYSGDVIALTGGPDGALNRLICAGRLEEAEKWLDRLIAYFPDRLYVELQRHGLSNEIEAEKTLIAWAYDKGLPLVATNEPYFLLVEGKRLDHPMLEAGDRKRMKVLRVNSQEDLPIETVNVVLQEALDLYRNGTIKTK